MKKKIRKNFSDRNILGNFDDFGFNYIIISHKGLKKFPTTTLKNLLEFYNVENFVGNNQITKKYFLLYYVFKLLSEFVNINKPIEKIISQIDSKKNEEILHKNYKDYIFG